MVHRARDLATAEPRAHFVVADAHQLPFLDGAFTAELCTTALRHFTDLTGAVQEMVRVLAPGGRLVLADLLTEATHPRTVGSLRRRQPYATAADALRGAGLRLGRPSIVTTAFGPYVITLATNLTSAAAAPRRSPPGGAGHPHLPRWIREYAMRPEDPQEVPDRARRRAIEPAPPLAERLPTRRRWHHGRP
jgi:SAM-dependent methyltransferase